MTLPFVSVSSYYAKDDCKHIHIGCLRLRETFLTVLKVTVISMTYIEIHLLKVSNWSESLLNWRECRNIKITVSLRQRL